MKKLIVLLLSFLGIISMGCSDEPKKIENKPVPQSTSQVQQPQQQAENSPATRLLGKWDRVDDGTCPDRVEFLPDNTLISGKMSPKSQKYRFIDAERIEIQNATDAVVIHFSFDGDTLYLCDGPDKSSYKKLP